MTELVEKNLRYLREQFVANGIGFVLRGSKVVVTGDSYSIKDTLKGLGFKWNPEGKVWEAPVSVFQDQDFANSYVGPFQSITNTKNQILQEIKEIKTPFLHQLLEFFLIKGPYKDTFFNAPGAKTIHHAYSGGLAEHTLQVLIGSKKMAEIYPYLAINRELLITGAILHDIGKIDCYATTSEGIITTKNIELFDRIILGVSLVSRAAANLVHSSEDENLFGGLNHIITSHHNLQEWGSPKEPIIPEAWIIHINDLLSARIGGSTKLKL